jgi:hypothetical protein
MAKQYHAAHLSSEILLFLCYEILRLCYVWVILSTIIGAAQGAQGRSFAEAAFAAKVISHNNSILIFYSFAVNSNQYQYFTPKRNKNDFCVLKIHSLRLF